MGHSGRAVKTTACSRSGGIETHQRVRAESRTDTNRFLGMLIPGQIPGTRTNSGDTILNFWTKFRGHHTQFRIPGTPYSIPGTKFPEFRGHHTQFRGQNSGDTILNFSVAIRSIFSICNALCQGGLLTLLDVPPSVCYPSGRRWQRRGPKPGEQRNLDLRIGRESASRHDDC